MANRVKEVSTFDGTSWGAAVPLGANDSNIDITSSTTQPDGSAVSGVAGDTATALDTSAVAVSEGDTSASAWTKFNRFRKRVASNFANYMQGSIATSYNATGSDSAVYSTNVLNNYMSNVIGYSGTTTPSDGTVASQLSSLDSNLSNKLSQYTKYYSAESGTIIDTMSDGVVLVATSSSVNTSLYKALGSSGSFAYVIQIYYGHSSTSAHMQLAFPFNTSQTIFAWRIYNGGWGGWRSFGNIMSSNGVLLVSKRIGVSSKTGTIAAGSDHVSLTASPPNSGTFLTWYNIASSGWVGSVYAENATNKTSNMWAATGSTASARNIVGFFLYTY